MEELFELKNYIEQGHYPEAMLLIQEMEEMSLDDKINKIRSFTIVLLLHLIKKKAEKRCTRSWEFSIRNSIREITYINKRRKAGGFYLKESDIKAIISEAWQSALERASFEAFEGRYDEDKLAEMIDEDEIKKDALKMISDEQKNKSI